MVFSKSFGYALRSILYLVMVSEEQPRVQIHEVAYHLKVPKHFLGKIMQQLAKEGIIDSVRGPSGGFSINERTTTTPLIKIIELTDGLQQFKECVMRLKKCNAARPCPMHNRIEKNRKELTLIFTGTTVGDLIKTDVEDFVNYI